MNSVGFLIDDCFLKHDPGSHHPESPRRLNAIKEALDSFGAHERWRRVEPRTARLDELELIHHSNHLENVEKASRRAPASLDPDTVVSADSYRTGIMAAGAVLNCTEEICLGNLKRVFAFVRPPGHHAEPNRAMGFCLFNNVALAAAYARVEHKLERVAVVDIDIHHGNGTQACFYDDPHVLYVSSHQFPFYPGTGAVNEIGRKEGVGYTVNIPLPAGAGDETFVPIYSHIVAPILEQYKPQLILVSAGFDAYFRDPLGGLTVTDGGYGSAASSLIRVAERCCEGRICFVLEGGYSPEGLQSCSQAVMAQMERPSEEEAPHPDNALFKQISALAGEYLGNFWKW